MLNPNFQNELSSQVLFGIRCPIYINITMSNSHLFLKSRFLTSPSQNGVGRYVCQLQRVVLKFCKHSGSSRGMREFIESNLIDFAKENPGVVVYIKPRRHRSAILSAEYLNGDKQWISCRNVSQSEILKWLNLLKSQQNNPSGLRLRKLWHTDVPSIQGPWTPYTFRDPALNLASFPSEDLSKPLGSEKSATEILIDLFKNQEIKEAQ